MYEGPEFRHLRSFLAVAEECSFGKAARRLHVTQPALSTQIKQLEDGLRATLFLRGRAGASLTHPGRTLVPLAMQLLAMQKKTVEHVALAHTGSQLPFRFGYSPWIKLDAVHETITGYKEMVPGGVIEASSHFSSALAVQVLAGSLDAALVNLPIRETDLTVQTVCTERMLVCMRSDDPLALGENVPKNALEDGLKIMFERNLHPLLFDQIVRKLARADVHINPTEFVAHPNDLQFLVKEKAGLGLMREGSPLQSDLTSRPIEGVTLPIETAFICHEAQQRPVLPLLAHRVAKCCAESALMSRRKKPVGRVTESDAEHRSRTG